MSILLDCVPDLPELQVVDVPTEANPHAGVIAAAVEEWQHLPQVEMPVTHRFSPGVYIREIFMPANTVVVGYVHKTRHFNIVLTGRALVQMEGRTEEIVAPCTFESGPGVQKVLLILEDMRWQTVHANPQDCQDVATIEELLVVLTPELIEQKAGRTLDQFRHAIATIEPSINGQLH